MSAVSIKTIAQKAGVSPSTVSRALRNDPRISPETTQRVQTLAQELGYVPSQVARSLVLQRTRTLGIVVTTAADPYVSQVLSGVEEAAASAGYATILATSGGLPEQELQAVEMLRQRWVDALIVISSRASDLYGAIMAEIDQPVVLVNGQANAPGCYSVRIDSVAAARLATHHLLGLGHRRIAFIGGPASGRSSAHRREGYLAALQDAGLRVDHRLLLPGVGEAADGRRALPWILDLQATAVVCYNDMTAFGLLAAAAAIGVDVPGELSLVGIDNLPYAELSYPPLTTVDQRAAELGRTAVEIALRAVEGQPARDVVLEADLVVRASTAPPPEP